MIDKSDIICVSRAWLVKKDFNLSTTLTFVFVYNVHRHIYIEIIVHQIS